MMAAATLSDPAHEMGNDLSYSFEGLRGRLQYRARLAPFSWFRVGGPADILFRPEDLEDLRAFLAQKPTVLPLTIIGAASNLIIRDGGVEGAVIRLTGPFSSISAEADGETPMLCAGAGAAGLTIARAARDAGIGGLEFLAGIPGTLGGAVRMNAGAYGAEIRDVLDRVEVLTPEGTLRVIGADRLGLTYRHSEMPADWIVTRAWLRGTPDTPARIAERIEAIQAKRAETQPVTERTGGSTFANPEGAKAWELIDAAGCRGLMIGGAQVSSLHCNFLINTGDATAADLETLGDTVRERVLAHSGVLLRWEIARIGRHSVEGDTGI